MRLLILLAVSALATPVAADDAAASLTRGLDAYHTGRFDVARRAFAALADHDSAIAETMLGSMYAKGQGVRADPVTATTYYFRAAERGYAPAQLAFARALANGDGIAPDRNAAWVRARLAQQRGDARVAAAAKLMVASLEIGMPAATRIRLERELTAWRPWATGRD